MDKNLLDSLKKEVTNPQTLLTLLTAIQEIAQGKRLDPATEGEIAATIQELEDNLK